MCVINLEALIFHTLLISEDHLPAYEDIVHNYALNGELRLQTYFLIGWLAQFLTAGKGQVFTELCVCAGPYAALQHLGR